MKIKRALIFILITALSLCTLVSCKKDGEGSTEAIYYTVTFNSNGGTPVESRQVAMNGKIGDPGIPEKEGYVFDGWYNGNLEWDFSMDMVKSDITLSARWLAPENVFSHEPAGDGTTVITGVKKEVLKLTLPTAIGGYTVTAIGDRAFASLSSETYNTIIVPESITVIGDEAFKDCKGISIVVKGELTKVGERSFYGCTRLSSISLAEGMETITAEAFASCTSLSSVRIPQSVKTIGENTFDSCTSLKTVMLYAKDTVIENMAFSDAGLKAVYFYGTEAEIDSLVEERVDAGNKEFIESDMLIYSETEPAEKTAYDGYWYLDANGAVRKW